MAEKRFSGVNGPADSAELAADYEAAEVFDKLRVGRLGVYFRSGLRTKYIGYNELDRVFIRIHEVNGKLCCGSSVFQYFRMVFMREGKEYADFISEDESAMDAALSLIRQRAPGLATGFEQE